MTNLVPDLLLIHDDDTEKGYLDDQSHLNSLFHFFLHFKMFIIFTVVCHLFGDNNLFKNNFILILLDLSLPLVNSFLNTYQVAAPDPGVVHAVMCQV